MPRSQQSREDAIISYFRTTDLPIASVILRVVTGEVKARAAKSEEARTRALASQKKQTKAAVPAPAAAPAKVAAPKKTKPKGKKRGPRKAKPPVAETGQIAGTAGEEQYDLPEPEGDEPDPDQQD